MATRTRKRLGDREDAETGRDKRNTDRMRVTSEYADPIRHERRQGGFSFRNLFDVRRRIEFGDLVLVCYVAVFVRSYLWAVDAPGAAWGLTAVLTAALWCVYLVSKEPVGERVPIAFWVIVGVPLASVYLLRVAFPDLSYDVLNYRHVHAERGLRGFPFIPGDFFPTLLPLNPAPDMLTGIYRHLLGYRLGTIGNLLALLWTGEVLYKFLRSIVDDRRLRCVCVLLILLTEQLLFEINNYMVDVLALPLLVEAVRLVVGSERFCFERAPIIRLGFLLGSSVAFKITNVIYVAPLIVVAACRVIAARPPLTRRFVWRLICFGIVFVAPSLVHAVWVYRETGSPVFPLYNNIFRSPYWLANPVDDPRWGPKGWSETLTWSVSMIFHPERTSELPVYSGRLPLGIVAALWCCIVARRDKVLRSLAFMLVSGALLWSVASGYARYALFLEVLAGVVVVVLCRRLLAADDRVSALSPRRAAGVLLAVLLVAQCAAAINYSRLYEWGMRSTFLTHAADYAAESRNLMRDRDAVRFLTPEARAALDLVDVWVVSDAKTNGVEVLLKPNIPMISVHDRAYFETEAANRKFDRTLDQLAGRRMFSLAFTENLDAALTNLRRSALKAERTQEFRTHFFSPTISLDLQLIEVRPLREDELPGVLDDQPPRPPHRANAPLEPFDAAISLLDYTEHLRAGETATLRVEVKNAGSVTWRGVSGVGVPGGFSLGNHWLDRFGRRLINDDGRSPFTHDLAPGASVELPLRVTAPHPGGDYVLEIDVVQEQVAWFRDRGSRTVRVKVTIEE